MDKIPFSIYDFLGYVSAGVLLIVATDYTFDLGLLKSKQLTPAQIAFWVLAAYTTGHVSAQWGSWLLESVIVCRIGYPSSNLFTGESRRPFKHYRTPLPQPTATSIREKYVRMRGQDGGEQDLYYFCYHHVKENCPQAFARLSVFLGLYGFARNLSFALCVASAILIYGAYQRQSATLWWLAGAACFAALTLFFRYLKFYRHYTVEVLMSFLTGVKESEAIPNQTAGKTL